MVHNESISFSMKSYLSRHRMRRIVIIFPQSIWVSYLVSSNYEPSINLNPEHTISFLIVVEFVVIVRFVFVSSDPMKIYFGLVNNLAIDFKFTGSFIKSIQFYKHYMAAVVFIMLTLFESFIANKDLVGIIKLIGWVPIVHSIIWSVVSVFVCIRKFVLFPQKFLMNQSTCDCIPETHHVVPVDSSEQVVLLLPEYEVIFAF